MFSFNFSAAQRKKNKLRLTDGVVSRSGLGQHVEQRRVVGQGGHVQGDQALLADPVHSSLPLPLPLLVLLLSAVPHAASAPSAPAAGVVSGEQALHGQGVFILHRLPQGLVLAASAEKRAEIRPVDLKILKGSQVEAFFFNSGFCFLQARKEISSGAQII